MPKTYNIQNSFTGGEISPRLLGRTDLGQYTNSVREMYNCYPFLHGGVTRRRGTKYIWSVPSTDQTYAPKLIKFVYSRTISYLLVIHNNKMYFIRNGAVVESGGTPISLTAPWDDDELEDLRWSQSGNIMIFSHPNYVPKRLERVTSTSFSLTDLSFVSYAVGDYWFRTEPIDLKVITDGDIDTNYNVGQYWQWTTSGTSVTVNPVLYNSGGTPATAPLPGACVVTRVSGSGGNGNWKATCVYADDERTEWQVRAPNATYPVLTWTTGNYPQSVTFYQQRLWFGGSGNEPQTIWGSAIADYENFTLGSLDDDAVQFTIASGNYDPIVHLNAASQSLLPLTYSTEYVLSGNNTSITPTNVLVAAQTYHGSNDVYPLSIGTDTLFVQRDGKKMRSIFFDINQNQNLAKDLTLFAEHITGDGIIDAAFAQEPDYVVWCVREDGDVISMTYQRDESVTGWAHHNMTDPVKSIAVVPEATEDAVYMCVLRTEPSGYVDDFPTYMIEMYGDKYVDGYETFTSVTKEAIWTGLDRWEGKEVTVVADGFYGGKFTVEAGTIDIVQNAFEITIGYGYENHVTLLHTEVEAGGTSQARAMSLDKLTMRFQDTVGAYVQQTNNEETVLPFVKFSEGLFNKPTSPYTGDKTVNMLGWSIDNQIEIGQKYPLPWTLLAAVMRVTVNDQ